MRIFIGIFFSLFVIFVFILYINEGKHHPNTGLKTKLHFMSIGFGVCSIYKDRYYIPDNLSDAFSDKVFIRNISEFLYYNGYSKEIDYNELKKDEWGTDIQYYKSNKCNATLTSNGEDVTYNTEDDFTYDINCYCF